MDTQHTTCRESILEVAENFRFDSMCTLRDNFTSIVIKFHDHFYDYHENGIGKSEKK